MKPSIIVGIVVMGVAACGGESTGTGAKIAPAPTSSAADVRAEKGGAAPAPANPSR